MLIYLQAIDDPEDRTRFEAMYSAYRGLMFHVANRILQNPQDAEDAVHLAFLSLANHRLPPELGPQARHLAAVTAERKAIDLYRAQKRRPEAKLEDEERLPGCAPPPSDGTLAGAMATLLRRGRRRRWRTLALLVGVGAERKDDYRVYAAQEEGFIAYRALPREDSAGQPFHQMTPEWVPEGFSQDSTDIRENQSRLTYHCQKSRDQGFSLYQWHGREYTNTLTGSYRLEDVQVGGEDAIFFSSLDTPELYLLWTQGSDAFLLHGWGFPRDDLFHIAESLKW